MRAARWIPDGGGETIAGRATLIAEPAGWVAYPTEAMARKIDASGGYGKTCPGKILFDGVLYPWKRRAPQALSEEICAAVVGGASRADIAERYGMTELSVMHTLALTSGAGNG